MKKQSKKEYKKYIKKLPVFHPFGQQRNDDRHYKNYYDNYETAFNESSLLLEIKENRLKSKFKLISEKSEGNHIVIWVSGFLSEDSEPELLWKNLLSFEKNWPVYSYNWSSNTYSCFFPSVKTTDIITFGTAATVLSVPMVSVVQMVSRAWSSGIQGFKDSMKNSKSSGKLLAHALYMQYPFVNKSISLIGFSLGTQVIWSWLEELEKLGAYSISKCSLFNLCIVYNVYLLGGAFSISDNDKFSRSLDVVRGKVVNAYSFYDIALLVYTGITFSPPIGRTPIFDILDKKNMTEVEIECQKQYNKYRAKHKIQNYDVTDEVHLHINYRENLKEVLSKMKYSS